MNENNLKCFLVWHDGVWGGGATIVFATDKEVAFGMADSFLRDYYKEATDIHDVVELAMMGCYMIDDGDE